MDGRYFLCISFFFALIQSPLASGDLRKKHFSTGVAHHNSTSDRTGAVNMDKPVGLFSRRRSLSPVKQQVPKPRAETVRGSASPRPARYCARLMQPCSANCPCCNPCALCHCRLFNTICQCWKIGACPRKN